EFRSPDGEHFRVKFNESRQDPLSHHLNAMLYRGKASIESPEWGDFTCKLGPSDGQHCDPKDPRACGEGGICGSEPFNTIVCIGFGPDGDAFILNPEESLFNPVEAASSVLGVYEEVPLRGIVVWNSHAFNVYDEPAGLDAWVNFYFAAPEEQLRPRTRFVED